MTSRDNASGLGGMFLVMAWHGRRRLAAMEERLALEALQRVSADHLRLLE